jgi:hypothetical protein
MCASSSRPARVLHRSEETTSTAPVIHNITIVRLRAVSGKGGLRAAPPELRALPVTNRGKWIEQLPKSNPGGWQAGGQ